MPETGGLSQDLQGKQELPSRMGYLGTEGRGTGSPGKIRVLDLILPLTSVGDSLRMLLTSSKRKIQLTMTLAPKTVAFLKQQEA